MGAGASNVDSYGQFADEEEEDFLDFEDSVHSQCSSNGSQPGTPDMKGLPTDTLIIFDWDDTLLCSTAINTAQWSAIQLQQLERTVEGVLNLSMRLGDTMIVTNGNGTWVHDSSRRFLPRLAPLLARMEVISARAQFEDAYPGDPFAWKRAAFQKILEERQCKNGGSPYADRVHLEDGLNLVVIGDSPAEMEAAQTAVKAVGGKSLVKTVKFTEFPSVQQVLGQLRRTARELGGIVRTNTNISRGLQQRELPENMAHMAAWASGWRICEFGSWHCPQPIARNLFADASKDEKDVLTLELPEFPEWMAMLKTRLSCYAVPNAQ